MARPFAPLNRRALVAGAAALVVAAGFSALLAREDEPAPTQSVGRAYRVTYDVLDATTGVRTREAVEVDRPLRSRRVTGAAGSATTEDGVYDRAEGVWRQVAVVPPGEVGQQLQPQAALEWAAGAGLARPDGRGTVAGRRCSWWVTKEPLDIAAVSAPTEDDRTRSCVDSDGLLLADQWRAGGRDLRRRTAAEVRRLSRLDVFDGMQPQPLAPALALTAVERVSPPVDDLVVLTPPPDSELLTATRSVDIDPGTSAVVRRVLRVVYARSWEVTVVDQVRGPVDVRGLEVDLGALGTGHVQATGGGLVVTVSLGPEQALRVRSGLSYDDLVAWLSGLGRAQ